SLRAPGAGCPTHSEIQGIGRLSVTICPLPNQAEPIRAVSLGLPWHDPRTPAGLLPGLPPPRSLQGAVLRLPQQGLTRPAAALIRSAAPQQATGRAHHRMAPAAALAAPAAAGPAGRTPGAIPQGRAL